MESAVSLHQAQDRNIVVRRLLPLLCIEKIVVWETGTLASELWNRRPNFNMDMIAFVDNDKARQGSYFRGIRVISPDKLKDVEYNKVVICFHVVEEIREQLI